MLFSLDLRSEYDITLLIQVIISEKLCYEAYKRHVCFLNVIDWAIDNTHPYDQSNGLNAVGSNDLCK